MENVHTEVASVRGSLSAAELELAKLIIASLGLEIQPQEVAPTTSLFGDGLGLDSIDVLEVALAIAKHYGVKLRSDDPESEKVFASLRTLSEYIQARRTR